VRGCREEAVNKGSCTINNFVVFQQDVICNFEIRCSNILYCGLFNDAVSASDFIGANDMRRIAEKLGEKQSWLNTGTVLEFAWSN
jgi:hypothetical protein